MGCHICQCIGIDYVVAITGTQKFDKINAALTVCTFKIGKQIVSDKGADTIFSIIHHLLVIHNYIARKFYEQKRKESTFYKTAKFYSVEKVLDELKNAGFGAYEVNQTLFGELDETDSFEPALTGLEPFYGYWQYHSHQILFWRMKD